MIFWSWSKKKEKIEGGGGLVRNKVVKFHNFSFFMNENLHIKIDGTIVLCFEIVKNPFQLQKRLKNDPKKIKYFEHFSGPPPPCQEG